MGQRGDQNGLLNRAKKTFVSKASLLTRDDRQNPPIQLLRLDYTVSGRQYICLGIFFIMKFLQVMCLGSFDSPRVNKLDNHEHIIFENFIMK